MTQPTLAPRVRLQLDLPLEMKEQLLAQAHREQRPMMELAREALADYLAHKVNTKEADNQ